MKKRNKISKTFIGFLIVSTLIWLLITLSKEYVTEITFPVFYQKIPQNKILQTPPKKKINLVVRATGFKIISSKFTQKPIQLNASGLSKKSPTKFYFLTKKKINSIQKQVVDGIEVKEITPDTLFLNLGALRSKKVAVKPNLEIHYHIGYELSENLKITPDSLLVFGSKAEINKLKFLKTSILKLDNVNANFTKKVTILTPKKVKNIHFDKKYATITAKVEKFTEGSLEVPFKVINLPKKTRLTTLSKTIEVVFVVGLSRFSTINKNSFKIECDYKLSKKNNLSYLIPKIVSKSNFVKSYKLIPNKIDFLIQK